MNLKKVRQNDAPYKLKNNDKEFLIAEDKYGQKKYYMSKKLEGGPVFQPGRVGTVPPSDSIITHGNADFNPSSMQNNTQQPLPFMDWLKKRRWGR